MAPRGPVARAALLAAALARAAAAGEPSCGLSEACGPQDVEAAEEASVDALRVELLQSRGKLLPTRSAAGPSAGEQLNGTSLSTLGRQTKAQDTCLGEGLGLLIQSQAPECLQACPSLCPHAIPAVALALEESRARLDICAHQAALACVTGPRGAEACASVLAFAPRLVSAAGSPSELEALCSRSDDVGAAHSPRGGLLEFAAGALARRGEAEREESRALSLEGSVSRKEPFPPCIGKPEGRNCMPPNGSEYSNSTVYCTAGKYQLQSTHIVFCEPLSRCVGQGKCDDPFCRNGGADRGDGRYCHEGKIVSCTGDDAPVTEDSCSPRIYQSSYGCTTTTQRHCVHQGDDFSCVDGSSSTYCTTTTTRRYYGNNYNNYYR